MTPQRTHIDSMIQLLDAIAVALSGWGAYLLRFDGHAPSAHYVGLMVIGVLLTLLVFPLFGLYRSWRGGQLMDLVGHALLATGSVYLFIILGLFALQLGESYSRIWIAFWAAMSAFSITSLRIATYITLHHMRKRGLNQKRILLVGQGSYAEQLLQRCNESHWAGYEIAVQVDAEQIDRVVTENWIREQVIDEVWISLPLREEDRIRHLLHLLRHEPIVIRYAPDISSLRLLNHDISTILGVPMLDLRSTPMQGVNLWIKALEDRLLAALILLLVSPLMLLIAIGVKLSSPGPILFKQKRLGWGGREINVYKFRSMVVHDAATADSQQATRSDARITRFGAFLRRTSLDELPQFINVLQGRMSIVGPRPHTLAHNEHYKELIDSYMLRHNVKPGITGWAQINGFRGETDTLEKMQKRIDYDLYYIEHWSLGFDLKIILLTLFKGFVHPNAY